MLKDWHEQKVRVHYKDTDQMGVVHHGNYVSWFEIGRTELMRNIGIAYSEMENSGLLLPVLDLSVTYSKPALYDECVRIFTKLTHFTAIRMEFEYEIIRSNETKQKVDAKSTGELLASGKTLHMWLNKEWKPARIDKVAPNVFKLLHNLKGEK